MSNQILITDIIKKRKLGVNHSDAELEFLISGYIDGSLPDYQVAAWLMATRFNELSKENTAKLTQIMRDSGEIFSFPKEQFVVDKHSTGGIGDKTTMTLGPIVAAAGIKMASIAGRGLGHTGGTLDKLEAIKGFNVFQSTENFKKLVLQHNICIAGQTDNICPADKKLYALRDVTSTVDSLSLISASIMSKKLAEGISALVLDVKYGTGAFMKTIEQAKELAGWLKSIGELNGIKVHALLTNMNQPLGRYAGNGLEIKECIDILSGKKCVENGIDFYQDTRELSVTLAGHMIYMAGKANDLPNGIKLADEILQSGRALEKFYEMCEAQGATLPLEITSTDNKYIIKSTKAGYIQTIDCEEIGLIGIQLKAGRLEKSESILHENGIEFHFKLNSKISVGDSLFTIYSNDPSLYKIAENKLLEIITFSEQKNEDFTLIETVLM